MELTQRITELLTPSLNNKGYLLVRVLLSGADSGQTLQIMVEREDGKSMTVDDCESVSRLASTLLDVDDPIASRYLLEVTSPGIDRPLIKVQDFIRFKGNEIKLETTLPVDGRKRFKGLLKGLDETKTQVQMVFEGKDISIPLSSVNKAKLVLTDELVQQFLKKNK